MFKAEINKIRLNIVPMELTKAEISGTCYSNNKLLNFRFKNHRTITKQNKQTNKKKTKIGIYKELLI